MPNEDEMNKFRQEVKKIPHAAMSPKRRAFYVWQAQMKKKSEWLCRQHW
jgi:hypothetical protein